MFGPTDPTAARPPSSGTALTLLCLAAALLVGILSYSLVLSARADRHLLDLDRTAALRLLPPELHAVGLPGHPAAGTRADRWGQLQAARAEADPQDPAEAAAWADLRAEADAGPVRWATARRYADWADRRAADLTRLARAEAATADRLFALGLVSLLLIGAAAGLLVVRLRKTAARLDEQGASFRLFLDNSPVIAFIKDAAGTYRYVSRAGRERFGLAPGAGGTRLLNAADAAAVAAADRRALHDGLPATGEFTIPTPGGDPTHWLVTKFPLPGREPLLGGLSVEVTDRRRAEAALRASEDRLRLVVGRLPAIVCVAEADGTVALLEGQGLALIGRRPGDGVGRPFGEVLRGGPISPLALALALGGQEQLLAATAAGRAFDVHYLPSRDPAGTVRAVAVAVDVSDRAAKSRRLEQARLELEGLARRDALTGLPNRRALDERLSEECSRADRFRLPLAVVLADVDHFKRLNDTLGHAAGDRALAAVAQALRQTGREADVVARYGGEEFCILLPGADVGAAAAVAERLRAAVQACDFPDRPLTASFGVAGWQPGDGPVVPAQLLAAADRGLYRAKANGRDRVEADPQAARPAAAVPG